MDISSKFPRKRAFITGAASGLGAALCRTLAADGWTLGMCDVREELLREEAKHVDAAGGVGHVLVLDVTDRNAYRKTAKEFLASYDGIDLLVNNAGVATGGPMEDCPLEDWQWLLEINLMGVVNGCHFFVPRFKEQRSGHILNVASMAAIVPVPRMAAYCTAKAGVKMLSEVLHNELIDHDVGVSVLMPDFFRTNIHESVRGGDAMQARLLVNGARYSAEEVAKAALAAVARGELHIPFGRRTRLYWWLQRLAPGFFSSLIRKERHKLDLKLNARLEALGATELAGQTLDKPSKPRGRRVKAKES